jgi:hypothetical protein
MASCPHQGSGRTSLPAVVYEREPGAAAQPLPAGYRRRAPETTVLYQVVQAHLETFLADARARSDAGAGYPTFVEREFRKFLDCGILARGFSRLRCPACGHERFVAFSCKGRLCPSCWGRRTADSAAHLVDRVFPAIPYRQYVLTFPWPLRLPLAFDHRFLSQALRRFLRALFAWQRLRGRRLGIRAGQTGAVSFVQRFGGALNANPHVHAVVPDGLFVPGARPEDPLTFVPLPPPSDDDLARLTTRVVARITALAERRRAATEDLPLDPDDEDAHLRAALAQAQLVPRDPAVRATAATPEHARPKPLCAEREGFTLHVARTVDAADRTGLEQLCRYGLRAPFATDRFSRDPDGRVCYRLLKPWPTPQGRSELHLEPLALLRRLAALIPAPYVNLVRYAGVFANRSRFRSRLPPPPVPTPPEPPPLPAAAPLPETPPGQPHTQGEPPVPAAAAAPPVPPPLRPRRLRWAQLLRRALDQGGLTCPHCSIPMVVLAFLSDPQVVRKILLHLQLPAAPPPLAPGRLPEPEEFLPPVPDDDGNQDPDEGHVQRQAHARGPP